MNAEGRGGISNFNSSVMWSLDQVCPQPSLSQYNMPYLCGQAFPSLITLSLSVLVVKSSLKRINTDELRQKLITLHSIHVAGWQSEDVRKC